MNFDFTARYMRNFSREISHAVTLPVYAFMKTFINNFRNGTKHYW